MKKTSHKYGVEVPRSISEAFSIDEKNGNTLRIGECCCTQTPWPWSYPFSVVWGVVDDEEHGECAGWGRQQ